MRPLKCFRLTLTLMLLLVVITTSGTEAGAIDDGLVAEVLALDDPVLEYELSESLSRLGPVDISCTLPDDTVVSQHYGEGEKIFQGETVFTVGKVINQLKDRNVYVEGTVTDGAGEQTKTARVYYFNRDCVLQWRVPTSDEIPV